MPTEITKTGQHNDTCCATKCIATRRILFGCIQQRAPSGPASAVLPKALRWLCSRCTDLRVGLDTGGQDRQRARSELLLLLFLPLVYAHWLRCRHPAKCLGPTEVQRLQRLVGDPRGSNRSRAKKQRGGRSSGSVLALPQGLSQTLKTSTGSLGTRSHTLFVSQRHRASTADGPQPGIGGW